MADQSSSKFHEIPDPLWERIDLVIPRYKRSRKGGRKRLPMRNVVGGILYGAIVKSCVRGNSSGGGLIASCAVFERDSLDDIGQ